MKTTSFNGKLRTFSSRHALAGTTYSNDWISASPHDSQFTEIYTTPYGSADISLMSTVDTTLNRYAIDLDNQGDFYISKLNPGGGSFVNKINKVGEVLATQSSTHPDPNLYSDGEYIYFVDGSTSFGKYDKNLNKVWSHTQSVAYYSTRGISSDLDGNVFVSYGSSTNSKVNKLSATGSLLWTATASSTILSLATDKYGYLYIGQSIMAMVKKVDPNGSTIFDKSVTFGTFASYSVAHISVVKQTDTIYLGVYDYSKQTAATPSVPVIAYDLDLNQKSNLNVYPGNTSAGYDSRFVDVSGSQYVYIVKPIGNTASVIEKWDDTTYLKLATSPVIYHSSPGFYGGPSLRINPIS